MSVGSSTEPLRIDCPQGSRVMKAVWPPAVAAFSEAAVKVLSSLTKRLVTAGVQPRTAATRRSSAGSARGTSSPKKGGLLRVAGAAPAPLEVAADPPLEHAASWLATSTPASRRKARFART